MRSIREMIANCPEFLPNGEKSFKYAVLRAIEDKQRGVQRKPAEPPTPPPSEAELAREREAERDAFEREQLEFAPRALSLMGLQKLEIHSLLRLEDRPAVQSVDEFMTSGFLFLLLGGGVGSGKTIAAASALFRCKSPERRGGFDVKRWEPKWGRFVKADDMARSSYYGEPALAELDTYKTVPILVIDDLGAEQISEPWFATLGNILDARGRAMLQTILTTNLGAKTFRERYGDRVWRRVKEHGLLKSTGGGTV